MYTQIAERCMAFEGSRCIARGKMREVAVAVKAHIDSSPDASILLFDEDTAHIVEVDFRGDASDVLARIDGMLASAAAARDGAEKGEKERRGPGRPKLGVVSREVTLLPRHWEWLSTQPGGASVTLRKLVEAARKANSGKDRIRSAQEITYRFMNAVGGDFPGYEEALRALYAPDAARFASLVAEWPEDVREHVLRFARSAFAEEE